MRRGKKASDLSWRHLAGRLDLCDELGAKRTWASGVGNDADPGIPARPAPLKVAATDVSRCLSALALIRAMDGMRAIVT